MMTIVFAILFVCSLVAIFCLYRLTIGLRNLHRGYAGRDGVFWVTNVDKDVTGVVEFSDGYKCPARIWREIGTRKREYNTFKRCQVKVHHFEGLRNGIAFVEDQE